VGPRAGLDAVAKKKITLLPLPEIIGIDKS
jgi:hypothetical protein